MRNSKSWIIISVLITIAIAIGFGVWFYLEDAGTNETPRSNNTTNLTSVKNDAVNQDPTTISTTNDISPQDSQNTVDVQPITLDDGQDFYRTYLYAGGSGNASDDFIVNQIESKCAVWQGIDHTLKSYEIRTMPEGWTVIKPTPLQTQCIGTDGDDCTGEKQFQCFRFQLEWKVYIPGCFDDHFECFEKCNDWQFIKLDDSECTYQKGDEQSCCNQLGFTFVEESIALITEDEVEKEKYESEIKVIDADQDLVHHTVELMHGTDDTKADTDGDGYNDYDEILRCYQPNGTDTIQSDDFNHYCKKYFKLYELYAAEEDLPSYSSVSDKLCDLWTPYSAKIIQSRSDGLLTLEGFDEGEEYNQVCNQTVELVDDPTEEHETCYTMMEMVYYLCGPKIEDPYNYYEPGIIGPDVLENTLSWWDLTDW